MTEVESTKKTLYIVGIGVSIPDHLSVAATDALMRCECVYTLVQEDPNSWMPSTALGKAKVVNLMPFYAEGAPRTDNYAKVAASILAGLDTFSHVGYVTYGNPFCFDSVAQILTRSVAPTSRLIVIPAVSSVDTILCDLRRDMAPGIQIFEATWLVSNNMPLNPAIDAILLQLGHFGTLSAHYRDRRGADQLSELVRHLRMFYSPSHVVYLVQSSNGMQASSAFEVALAHLCEVDRAQWAESMYIPARTPVELCQSN